VICSRLPRKLSTFPLEAEVCEPFATAVQLRCVHFPVRHFSPKKPAEQSSLATSSHAALCPEWTCFHKLPTGRRPGFHVSSGRFLHFREESGEL
jgi:hypothetical protein